MPFGDDLELPAVSNLPGRPFLLRVFTAPERFRFEFVNEGLQGAATPGTFLDEIALDRDFGFLRAQSSATVEAAEPTLLGLTEASGRNFSRLLLPLWGQGQLSCSWAQSRPDCLKRFGPEPKAPARAIDEAGDGALLF